MKTYGKITSIDEVHDITNGNRFPLENAKGARLGFSGMLNALSGGQKMDGYRVKTATHEIHILIDNDQSCCENWGYMTSDDDLKSYVGATLRSIETTDTALATMEIAIKGAHEYGFEDGGIQFVTFKTSKGDFQIAVYNAHNGYYGHGILVAVDDEIVLTDTI